MNETQTKKRGWVKNAAIIFLAVLLVLTFFSNTILNHSLPEVAAQYVSGGTINPKIRGTGQVTANDSYEITLAQTRKIQSVLKRVGDTVNVGDVLFTLEGTESEELQTAREALEDLELNYRKAVLNAADADYTQQNRDIQVARETLAELEAKRDANAVTAEEQQSAQANVNYAEQRVVALQAELDSLNDQLSNLGGGGGGDLTGLWNAVQEAKAALDAAEDNLASYQLVYGMDYEAFRNKAIQEKMRPDVEKEVRAKPYRGDSKSYSWWIQYLTNPADSTLNPAPTDEDAAKAKEWGVTAETLQAEVQTLTDEALNSATWVAKQSIYMAALALETEEGDSGLEAYNAIKGAEDQVAEKQSAYNTANQSYSQALGSDNSSARAQLQRRITEKQAEVTRAQQQKTGYDEELAALQEKKTQYDSYNTQVKEQSRTLENLIFQLSEQQKDDEKAAALQELDLEGMRTQIARQEAVVAELEEDVTVSEITSPVAGVLKSVNVTAGNQNTPNEPMAVIEVVDRGYTVSFSVTTEQAKRVSIGDVAEITSYYWGSNLTATLTAIRNDPNNPTQNRLLEFTIRGDVETGTSLSLSIGERSQQYDMIVPSSAVRSDSNGSFVLVVVAKSTPLGNRYVTERVNVTELASDDTNTAIAGALTNGDYVVTTSTKPLEAGMQVRLVES